VSAPPRQLVVLARWPVPGRCKTRLAAAIGRQRAAAVQRRLSAHTLACCRDLLAGGASLPAVAIVLAAAPLAPAAARRWAQQLGVTRGVAQGAGGLGLRLSRQLHRAFREGAQQVVLIGSDLPQLQPADLAAAFQALEASELVLGPAHDGGYWLIGLRRGAPPALGRDLFSGMPWGGPEVLGRSLAVAARHAVAPALLAYRHDLDRASDLGAWR